MRSLLAFAMMWSLMQQPPPQQQDGKPCEAVDGGSHVLSPEMSSALATRYRSWQVRLQCVGEAKELGLDPKWASVASGDYDGDGRIDQAVLLQQKSALDRTIVVVFLSSGGAAPVLAGDGSMHLGTVNRGSRGHDYEAVRDFTFTRDAIATGDYHCCGFSLVWRSGRFVRIFTHD